jgi:hypothetical protein
LPLGYHPVQRPVQVLSTGTVRALADPTRVFGSALPARLGVNALT